MARRLSVTVWLAWCAPACLALPGPTVQADPPRRAYEFLEWSDPAGAAQGLVLTAFARDAWAFQLLIHRAGKPRLVLATCLDSGLGGIRTRLTDDDTGWWIEIRDFDRGAAARTTDEFEERRRARLRNGYRATVVSSEGASVEVSVPGYSGDKPPNSWWPIPEMARAAGAKFREEDRLPELPPSVVAATSFLDLVTSSEASYRPIVAIVLEIAGVPTVSDKSIRVVRSGVHPGFGESTVQEFLAGFRTVSPSAPMGDFTLRDQPGPGRCSTPNTGARN